MITFSITTSGTAPAALQARVRALGPGRRDLNAVLGKGLENDLRRHFRARSLQPNKKGWPTQGFWAGIRGATAYRSADVNDATVAVAGGEGRKLALKIHGGTVRPVRGKLLSIPLRPEVAGKMPRGNPIPGLTLIRSKTLGKLFLATRSPEGRLTVYYALVPYTRHQPDPHALPEPAQIEAAAIRRTEQFLARLPG